MNIVTLPLLSDNYAYLLVDSIRGDCAVVDPSEGEPVLAAIAARRLTLRAILATHHHPDHVGGIAALVAAQAEAPTVYCSRVDAARGRIPCATAPLDDGQEVEVLGQTVRCLQVPGHTQGAVAYWMAEQRALYTGDTLFLGGCGRLFEGTAAQMHASLQRLAALDPQTQIFCGHEYTQKNYQFARSLAPDDAALAVHLSQAEAVRQRQAPTVPGTLADELRFNPFLRPTGAAAALGVAADDPIAAFAALRERRNSF